MFDYAALVESASALSAGSRHTVYRVMIRRRHDRVYVFEGCSGYRQPAYAVIDTDLPNWAMVVDENVTHYWRLGSRLVLYDMPGRSANSTQVGLLCGRG